MPSLGRGNGTMVVVLETEDESVIWQLCEAVIEGRVGALYKVPDSQVAFLRPDKQLKVVEGLKEA